MLPGDFLRKLQRCNSDIRIVASRDFHKFASGLYVLNGLTLVHKCGVDNIDIPEVGVVDHVGHIIKRGWRSTIDILIGQKIVRREDAEAVFNTRFGREYYKKPRLIGKEEKNLQKEIAKESAAYKNTHGGSEEAIGLSKDLMGDFASEIRKVAPIKKPNFEAIKNGRE